MTTHSCRIANSHRDHEIQRAISSSSLAFLLVLTVIAFGPTLLSAGAPGTGTQASGVTLSVFAPGTPFDAACTGVCTTSFSSQPLTLTASVPLGATGTYTFLADEYILGVAKGVKTFTTAGLGAGVHFLKVTYSGDSNYAPSTSATLTHTIVAKPQSGFTIPSSIPNSALIQIGR